MKNTKIFALVATVALLVIGAAFTSFAAQYNWYQQDDEWRCKDKNGDDYYAAWAKSGADWYWLNDEGFMAREALVDDETKYVDADGKMVKNDWKKIANDEGDEFWYYFQAGGKKLTGKEAGPKPVTVNGKKYIFDTDGKMLSGWVLADYADAKDDDYAWTEGIYYCGDEDDGAVTYGWRQIECYNEAEDFVDNNYWFWFGTNGLKFAATDDNSENAILRKKSINGKEYAFDVNGVMKAEWEQTVNTASNASASIGAYAWFQDAETGAKFANGWFRVVPMEKFDKDNYDDDAAKWFYAKSGKLARSEIKTINGKKYGFNAAGEMVTGLCAVSSDEIVDPADETKKTIVVFEAAGIDSAENLAKYVDSADAYDYGIYYFSDDEDNDGSQKTGLQTIKVDGDDYNFYFSTKAGSKGLGLCGKQGNKFYWNGKKIAADDAVADYQFFLKGEKGTKYEGMVANVATPLKDATKSYGKSVVVDASKYELISKTGVVATSGTKKDGNGNKFTFKKKNDDFAAGYWEIVTE